MKKKILFILLIGVVSLISIQCSKEKKENKQEKNQKNYEVKTQFAYSVDNGKTYEENREFKVGEIVYMRLSIEAIFKKDFIFSRSSLDFIDGEIIIPNITSVDAKYYEGTKITPFTDEKSGATTFPFQIPISLEEKEQKDFLIFQFIAKKESEISIELKFDDNIAEKYNKIETIKFVK